ncbi:AraC family transcriptional regulator [Neobacillus vireti]|uniref:AraC family transcriptional regulator n=1 Tax=Neobacillus vireti TaxID=220686 RepID=UPI003000973A
MEIEKVQHLVPDIFYFVDRRCLAEWEIIHNRIGFQDLTFVVEGKSNYFINGIKYTVEPGDVIYIPEGSIRQAYTYKEDPMHSFAFNFNWTPVGSPIALPLEPVTKNVLTNELRGYIRQFTQVWMSSQPGSVMEARALFMLILHRLLTITSQKSILVHTDLRVKKILEYMIDHYPEELDLSNMARNFHLHPVYLGKLFKKNTGYSFKEYLNMIRVNNAEMLLSTGEFSVTEVAERCGFHDVSYFSNVFKSMKGYPPSNVYK